VIDELIRDSERGLPLEASEAYRGAELDDAAAAEVRDAVRRQPDASRYHLLMLLARRRPERAAEIPASERAAVLAGALAALTFLNDFGHLDPAESYDGPAARELLATDGAAREPLAPLLADTREAPLRGSEAATMSHVYGYRRCDFAYRYLCLVLGETPEFDRDPGRRDAAIARLRERVAG
jgi:hypothetical protein